MKNSNDVIGNQIRNLPACSAVPQPTVPPRAPFYMCGDLKFHTHIQGVTGGTDQTSGECSLGQTIPI